MQPRNGLRNWTGGHGTPRAKIPVTTRQANSSEPRNPMRVTPKTREIIRDTTRQVFGQDAQVKLFGSRVDDLQRGGDIDLLVELPRPLPDSRKRSLTLAARLQMQLGDQPIDIVVIDPQTPLQAIHRHAAATAVHL